MSDFSPRLLQLRDCANGIALRHMARAKTLNFPHMMLSFDDPAEGAELGVERPVACIAHGINAEVQREWAVSRFREDPLRRMKARGAFSGAGARPLLWENHHGQITMSDGVASLTATEVNTMRWVYGYGARTGVNVRPCEFNGREVSISFYSERTRETIEDIENKIAILFYLSHMIAQDLKQELMRDTASPGVRLTRREKQCLEWVAAGKNAQETAIIMGLSVQTVRDHLKRVRAKLNSTTRAQALFRASALGLIEAL